MSEQTLLDRMPDLEDQRGWQNLVMTKNYELAMSTDPAISGKALERLAKCSPVGLLEDKVTVNINQLSQEELAHKLDTLVNRILARTDAENKLTKQYDDSSEE